MKLLLYIILGIVGLIVLLVGGTIVYTKYFDEPLGAVNELTKSSVLSADILDNIADLSKNFREKTKISIAVSVNDSIHYYGLGRSNDTLTTEVNHECVFEIGSISKVFTAYVIHELVLLNKVDLSKSILDYLPVSNENLKEVTIASLINHTSGLPKMPDNIKMGLGQDPYREYDKQLLFGYLESYEKDRQVGEQFDYSNVGYGILGAVAQAVTNETMESLYRRFIFSPMQMGNSSFYKDSVDYLVKPGLVALDNPMGYWNFDILGGAGAIKSSTDQMIRFANHMMSDANVPVLMRERTFSRDNGRNVGNGIFRIEKEDTAPIFFHNGATGGFNSAMAFDTAAQISVVVLSNRSIFANRNDHIDQICLNIIEELRSQ